MYLVFDCSVRVDIFFTKGLNDFGTNNFKTGVLGVGAYVNKSNESFEIERFDSEFISKQLIGVSNFHIKYFLILIRKNSFYFIFKVIFNFESHTRFLEIKK